MGIEGYTHLLRRRRERISVSQSRAPTGRRSLKRTLSDIRSRSRSYCNRPLRRFRWLRFNAFDDFARRVASVKFGRGVAAGYSLALVDHAPAKSSGLVRPNNNGRSRHLGLASRVVADGAEDAGKAKARHRRGSRPGSCTRRQVEPATRHIGHGRFCSPARGNARLQCDSMRESRHRRRMPLAEIRSISTKDH